MSKRTLTAGAIVAVALLAVGGLFASNMGFKLNYELQADTVLPNLGANTLALPYNRQAGLDTAQQLIDDIGSTVVANVQRYIKATNSFQTRDAAAGPNFNLQAGEGYFVFMSTGPTANYIAVGSHDPTLAVNLEQAGVGGPSDIGATLYAPPYHQTASTAQELINDIGSTNVANVQRYIEATNSYQTRDAAAGPNFNLIPGEAYFVFMTTTTSYTPSHY